MEFNFPANLFKEIDENQGLTYNLYVYEEGILSEVSNFWVTFDSSALRIYGSSLKSNLVGCETDNFYSLTINQTNVFGENISNTE